MKYYKTLPEEQETVVNINYYARTLHLYTSKKSVIKRLNAKLGESNKTDYINGYVTSASWSISFADKKRINIALSRPVLIGQMK